MQGEPPDDVEAVPEDELVDAPELDVAALLEDIADDCDDVTAALLDVAPP